MHLSRPSQLGVVLALAGTALVWQLFIPPIVGLAADNGYIYVGELTGQVFSVKP